MSDKTRKIIGYILLITVLVVVPVYYFTKAPEGLIEACHDRVIEKYDMKNYEFVGPPTWSDLGDHWTVTNSVSYTPWGRGGVTSLEFQCSLIQKSGEWHVKKVYKK